MLTLKLSASYHGSPLINELAEVQKGQATWPRSQTTVKHARYLNMVNFFIQSENI
jgi:hypothetical protein